MNLCLLKAAPFTLSSGGSGGGSAVDYSAFSDAIVSAFQGAVTNTLAMMAAVIPVGISIFAVMSMIGLAKKVFVKISGGGS